jgi:HK97 family phage prohead protease
MECRAYSTLEAKAFDGKNRTFKGWATTPSADRVQDTIDPLGAKFQNPLVLLHQHNHDAPIGTVTFGKPTAKGIEFEAHIPEIEEPGALKERVDTAWGEIKHGLVRAVSIGFRPIKYAYKDDGGIEFQEIEIFELSSVSIPANAEAVITAVKSMDAELRHAAGVPEPEIPQPDETAASGKTRVVKLNDPARARAKPFVINRIVRTGQDT